MNGYKVSGVRETENISKLIFYYIGLEKLVQFLQKVQVLFLKTFVTL